MSVKKRMEHMAPGGHTALMSDVLSTLHTPTDANSRFLNLWKNALNSLDHNY